jgi:hypothetical protein
MQKDEWQYDWKSFVDALSSRILVTQSNEDLSRPFGGKRVAWRGVLAKRDLDEIAPSVEIDLPPLKVQLPNGRSDVLDGISLPVAAGSSKQWMNLRIGDSVNFEATFPTSTPFPAIEVKHLKSGKSLILLGLNDGIPIDAQQRGQVKETS